MRSLMKALVAGDQRTRPTLKEARTGRGPLSQNETPGTFLTENAVLLPVGPMLLLIDRAMQFQKGPAILDHDLQVLPWCRFKGRSQMEL